MYITIYILGAHAQYAVSKLSVPNYHLVLTSYQPVESYTKFHIMMQLLVIIFSFMLFLEHMQSFCSNFVQTETTEMV